MMSQIAGALLPSLFAAPTVLVVAVVAPPELAGSWAAPDLRLDIELAQSRGRIDGGPWEPLEVLDVAGRMTTFTVGSEQFVGLFQKDTFTVTRSVDRKSRTLIRPYLRSTFSE